jgi:hypothetical protein
MEHLCSEDGPLGTTAALYLDFSSDDKMEAYSTYLNLRGFFFKTVYLNNRTDSQEGLTEKVLRCRCEAF